MKNYLFSLILIFTTSLAANSQSLYDWALACGHPFYGETKSSLSVDMDDNLFLAGNFVETAMFGSESISSLGGTDIFIAKYNNDGEVAWVIQDGGSDYDYLTALVHDENGFYIGGSFYGSTTIGSEVFSSVGSQDIFIARYNLNGNFLWAMHFGSIKTDYLNALDTDPDGNLIITGHFYDDIDFGDTVLYAIAASDIFLAKYNAAGERIWLQQAGGSSSDQSYALSCDEDGNFVFTASYFMDIQIGDTMLTTIDPTGVVMAKMDADGDLINAIQVDGNGLNAKSFASFDRNGNMFFVGNFTDQVNFGPYHFDAGAFNIDIFITKYNADGELMWADHGNGQGSDQLISISPGPLNDLYINGHFLDTIHFSDLTLKYTLCCGSAEIFMVRYTEDGTPTWGTQISGEQAMAESMVKNANDELFAAGIFNGELNIGQFIIESGDGFSNFLCGISTETVTSVDMAEKDKTSLLYPIPASDRLYIKYLEAGLTFNYILYDMKGQKIMNGTLSNGQSIDVSSIPPGEYLIRLYDTTSNSSEVSKVLIR